MRCFETTVSLDKKEHRELMEAMTGGHPLRLLFPLCSFLLLTMAFWGLSSSALEVAAAVIGLLALVWYLAYPAIASAISWKGNSEAWRDAPLQYRFFEENFSVQNATTMTQSEYTVIKRLVETEHLLILYTARNRVQMLLKGAFAYGEVEEFKAFIAEKTGLSWCNLAVAKRRRLRGVIASAAFFAAIALVISIHGIGYIKRSVTFTSADGSNTCTVMLPRFMKPTVDDSRYFGNDLTVDTVFYTTEELQAWLAAEEVDKPLTLDNFADIIKLEGMPKQGAWLKDGDDERYMMYSTDGWYICSVLHWTEDGCWVIMFSCPDERSDTYFNRFDEWRLSATYA